MMKLGDPSRTRTCNPRSRNPLLCPVELWDRFASTVTAYALRLHTIANMKIPLSCQDERTIFVRRATKR